MLSCGARCRAGTSAVPPVARKVESVGKGAAWLGPPDLVPDLCPAWLPPGLAPASPVTGGAPSTCTPASRPRGLQAVAQMLSSLQVFLESPHLTS